MSGGDERRILALDPGARRVGLALSDPLGITAQGLTTFDTRDGDLVTHLRALVAKHDVVRIVVGYPLSLAGRETDASRDAVALAEQLRGALGLPVDMWDERLSSAEAERTLRGSRAGKGAVDRIAAVLILQGYLDANRGAR
ncbi:MAG TPA: Holliday junction resolvase RuvX [Candidatus Krumholzibacteria bacterium]|nr:Holliday junction resolvase RuvX [Candidatus Krumholzibacteria bacterium]